MPIFYLLGQRGGKQDSYEKSRKTVPYQIANELNMPRTTGQKYLMKIMKYLDKHRSDYVDW